MKILTENNVVISYQIVGGGYTPNENQVVYEVDEIPEEVQRSAMGAYLYVDGSFVENPNYKPPEQPLSEMDEIRLALAELAEIVAGG